MCYPALFYCAIPPALSEGQDQAGGRLWVQQKLTPANLHRSKRRANRDVWWFWYHDRKMWIIIFQEKFLSVCAALFDKDALVWVDTAVIQSDKLFFQEKWELPYLVNAQIVHWYDLHSLNRVRYEYRLLRCLHYNWSCVCSLLLKFYVLECLTVKDDYLVWRQDYHVRFCS